MIKHSTTPGYVGGLVTGHIHPSQAHWPTERNEIIKTAWRAYGGVFPEHELPSGVMFYMGQRITREDFAVVAAGVPASAKTSDETRNEGGK